MFQHLEDALYDQDFPQWGRWLDDRGRPEHQLLPSGGRVETAKIAVHDAANPVRQLRSESFVAR